MGDGQGPMNKKQRTVAILAACSMLVLIFYPPWVEANRAITRSLGFAWLWVGPQYEVKETVTVPKSAGQRVVPVAATSPPEERDPNSNDLTLEDFATHFFLYQTVQVLQNPVAGGPSIPAPRFHLPVSLAQATCDGAPA
jgi:hypothetical protein